MAHVNGNMIGASSASTNYNGPHFCPKCGYNGIYAVNLAMELKATHDGKNSDYRDSGSLEAVQVHKPALLPLNGARHAEPLDRGERARIIQMGIDGKTPTQISEATGRPKASIYGVLHRARAQAAKEQEGVSPRARKGIKLPPRRHNMTCPECKQGGFTPQGLGAHRQKLHGVAGSGKRNSHTQPPAPISLKPLGPREAEAKALFDAGKSYEEIAQAMNLTVGSAISIKKKIRRKLPSWNLKAQPTTA